jgi:hypothetical protein
MTHYELQLARIRKYPTRHKVLIQTPKMLVFIVDDEVTYTHLYDEAGKCIEAFWSMPPRKTA